MRFKNDEFRKLRPALFAPANRSRALLSLRRTILGCVLLLAVSAPLHAVILDRIAAIVNDEVITQSEVYATVNSICNSRVFLPGAGRLIGGSIIISSCSNSPATSGPDR